MQVVVLGTKAAVSPSLPLRKVPVASVSLGFITQATSSLKLRKENFEGALERRDDGMQWVHRVMHRKDLTQVCMCSRDHRGRTSELHSSQQGSAGCGVKGTADRTEFLVSLSGPRKRRGLGGACLIRSKMLKPKLDLISTTELFRLHVFRLHVVPILMAFEPLDLPYCHVLRKYACRVCMSMYVCMYVCMC